jgi:hypothetical protein
MDIEDFKEALGGKIGGHVDDNGHWDCADCPASGYEITVLEAGRALYRHRQDARHGWDDAPDEAPH